MNLYKSEARAYRRASRLRQLGIWSGILRCGAYWRLSYDPAEIY